MKNLILVLALAFIITSCGKKQEAPKTETKKNETTQTQPNETKKESAVSNIFKVTTVENGKGEKMLPNFSWDENGKAASIMDYKGKVILINFWATWCAPCKKEMPDLSEINTELKDKNFKMIGVSVFQKGGQTIEDILKQIPVSYQIVDGNDAVVKAFEKAIGEPMDGVPTTVIVDKNGKIVETVVGMRDKATFNQMIKKYL